MKLVKRILGIVPAIAIIIQISLLEFNLGNAYYAILIAVFIGLLVSGKKLRLNSLTVWLVIAAFASILFNEIPAFFRPYERLIAFILVMGLVGPLVTNTLLRPFRLKLFQILNVLIVGMVVLSFLGIAVGLPAMVGRGGYAGLFNHSMMLSPMAAIAMLVSINWAHRAKIIQRRWLYWGMAAMSFLACLAAGSRAALVAGIAGGLFYFYKVNQGQLSRLAQTLILILTLAIFSFPAWEGYTERIMGKMAYAEEQGGLLTARSSLWETRVIEFRNSPLVGVGFASVNTAINTKFDTESGGVEPGSSWLAVLSMTGLFGFIPLILLLSGYLIFVYKDKTDKKTSALLGALLLFFTIHMLAEGYVLSAGSGLFFYFWLLMGVLEINLSSWNFKKYLLHEIRLFGYQLHATSTGIDTFGSQDPGNRDTRL
ncbi:O-antigen ligase family protein [uncultured Sunxiuqinia sp.]|uniref:O-antigen ligase family protein n=1 Tax=uncultured Sunxiuqinia sp. TaxID=1573825 RepID=UPI0026079F90|nr:O-antigen ligase family protein [uncultured Sunxiuqinia sp.]